LGNDLAHYLPNRLNIARLTHQAKGMGILTLIGIIIALIGIIIALK
jgi:hypothetical protein